MADLKYQPVKHDHKAFIERARKGKGFSESYENLEIEYQVADQLLKARARDAHAVGCKLEVRLVPEE